jgi:hypothetical protein
MEKQQLKPENATIINGVLLTPEAITTLKQMQDHDNEDLDYYAKSINEAVCLFVEIRMGVGNDTTYPELQETMQSLILARKAIEKLRKP